MFRKKSILGARMRRAGIDISVGIGQFVFNKLIECGYANANVVIEIGPSSKHKAIEPGDSDPWYVKDMDEDPYYLLIYETGNDEEVARIDRAIYRRKGGPNKFEWGISVFNKITLEWEEEGDIHSKYTLFGKGIASV